MDSDFGASAKGEVGSMNSMEMRTLAIQTRPWQLLEGATTTIHWLSGNLSDNLLTRGRQDFDRQMRNESPQWLAGGGGNNPQHPSATTWQQRWRAWTSSAAIRLGKVEPTQQSLPQQHRGLASVPSRRSSNTRPRDFWLA